MKDRLDIILAIAKRAEAMGISAEGRLTLLMDLGYADQEFNLQLEKLLIAADFDFIHDITGIQRHINRDTGKMGDCFLPRFSS